MSLPEADAPKPAWRAWAKARRALLTSPTLSAQTCSNIKAWKAFQEAKTVLVYLAFGSELSLADLMSVTGKTFCAPRTSRAGLRVHLLTGELEPHPHGYLQPLENAPEIDADAIDLALVPGLAFSRAGARLGYGKGYYDRFLPTLTPSALRVGVAASALILLSLPAEPHDVSMTHLASEQGVQSC